MFYGKERNTIEKLLDRIQDKRVLSVKTRSFGQFQ